MQIAILIQDVILFKSIKKIFDEDGFFTCHRFDLEASLVASVIRQDVDLVILNVSRLSAPDNVLLAWRDCHSLVTLPVIRTGVSLIPACMLAAFEAGADDILVGAFSPLELLVRAKQVIKRRTSLDKPAARIDYAPFTLDRTASVVHLYEKAIALTSREFALAWLFFSSLGKLLTRTQISHIIWGRDADIAGRTLEQHIYKLRRKLQLNGSNTSLRLSTVYSLGYKLEDCFYSKESKQG